MVREEPWGCHGVRLVERHKGWTLSGAVITCQVCSQPEPTWPGPPSCVGLTQSTWAMPASLRQLRTGGAPGAAYVSGAGLMPARQASTVRRAGRQAGSLDP